MTPPWKWSAAQRHEFMDRAHYYLLWAFIISILLNPFIVVATVGRSGGAYQVETNGVLGPGIATNLSLNTPSQYKKISLEEHESLQRWADQVEWTGLTALLGWMSSSPRFRRGWNYYKAKLQEREEKEKVQRR